MNVSACIAIHPLHEYVNSKLDANNIRTISQLQKDAQYETFQKYISAEEAGKKISEKSEDKKSEELRFRENSPIARPLEGAQIFNNTVKVNKKKLERYFSFNRDSQYESEVVSETKENFDYYIVSDKDFNFTSDSKKPLTYLQRIVRKAYRAGYVKDPGALVNLSA